MSRCRAMVNSQPWNSRSPPVKRSSRRVTSSQVSEAMSSAPSGFAGPQVAEQRRLQFLPQRRESPVVAPSGGVERLGEVAAGIVERAPGGTLSEFDAWKGDPSARSDA